MPGSINIAIETLYFTLKAFKNESKNTIMAIFDINNIFKPILELFKNIVNSDLDHSEYNIESNRDNFIYETDPDKMAERIN